MSQLCRLCLTESYDASDLNEYREGLPISVLAMIILPIKIYDGEDFNLPQKICSSCLEIIVNAYKLRDVSLSSEKVLRSSIEGCNIRIKNEVQDQDTIFVQSNIYNSDPQPIQKKIRKEVVKSSTNCIYCGLEFSTTDELDDHINEEHFSTMITTVCDEYEEGMHIDCYKKDRTPKTSMAWRHFGRLYTANNEHVNQSFHYCIICLSRKLLTKYKTTTATSTLIFHLTTVHGIGKDDNDADATFIKEKYTQRKERSLTTGPSITTTATICSECGKSFANHHIMKKHMKIHSGQFFPCDSCPAKFSYIENLYRHKRCHDPNHLSRYVCDICGNRFAEMKSLKNHIMRVHMKIPPQKKFACTFDGCSLKFAAAFNLKKHMITHTDLKPHECQFCSNAYTSKGDLIKHLQKNHVGDSIYHCEHCSESFRFKIQLREHYKVHYQGLTKEETRDEYESYSCN
ncbi:zinc finger protein 271-like [Chironomus tepperi]|uniref:zinc finger protein 271-like n=1 Tax=Chironomus tepperi TaxID=113505 RepID=UPI00391F5DE1